MFGVQIHNLNTYHKDDENWKRQWSSILKDLERGNDKIEHLKTIYEKKLKKADENADLMSALKAYETLFKIIGKMNVLLYNGLIVKSDFTYNYIRRAVKLMKEVIGHMKARNKLLSKFQLSS